MVGKETPNFKLQEKNNKSKRKNERPLEIKMKLRKAWINLRLKGWL